MSLPAAVFNQLERRFGQRLSLGEAVREQHGRGESYHSVHAPDAVVFACTTDEVSSVAELCNVHRIPLIPFGAGTSLEGNVSAPQGGICVDMSGMNAVLHVNVDDLDCTVQAGVTREQLNRELRDIGLFFPIDPGANASIGGMAATRASGTNAVRYGTMRDAVLGLTAVLADGRVIHTGTRARKSASGYDLTRLLVGSEGTLAIITEVTLRLHGIPEQIAVATCVFGSIAEAVQTVIAVIQMGIPIARVELLDRAQVRAVNLFSKTNFVEADTLFFEFHGGPRSVAEMIEQVQDAALSCGGSRFDFAEETEKRSRLWKARHEAFYATVALRPGSKGWSTDVCVPISRLSECIAEAQRLVGGIDTPSTIVGHVGDGNFHIVFAIDPDDIAECERIRQLSEALVALAIKMGGTATGEHGIGTGKIGFMELEHGEAVSVMRSVKQALDPRGVMNPGKVIPGTVVQ